MSSVDDLIGELFPGKAPASPSQTQKTSDPGSTSKQKVSAWDSDSDNDVGRSSSTKAGTEQKNYAGHTQAPPVQARRASVGHNFDDDSDDDICRSSPTTHQGAPRTSGDAHNFDADDDSSKDSIRRRPRVSLSGNPCVSAPTSDKHNTLFTVPFPNQSALTGLPACHSKCFVTNKAEVLTSAQVPAPTVTELRRVASGAYDASSTQAQMALRKGAYYVAAPKVGNGCLDGGANVPANISGGGGCPHMVCRRCNYGVVRLQGAEWVDGDGTVDLYLTLRNYYPDWSRLASSLPVGLSEEEQQRNGFVLRENPVSAAYCCQCAWLSVTAERVRIDTKLTDAAAYAGEGNAFASRLPLVRGEARRPPLWACKGHYLL